MPVARRIRRIMTGFSPVAGGGSNFTPNAGYSVVSGAFADQQLLRISKSGGGFGTKPGAAAPVGVFLYDSDLSAHSTLSRSGAISNRHTACSWSNTSPVTNALGSLRAGPMSDSSANPGWTFTSPPGEFCHFGHIRWSYDVTHDSIATNNKRDRAWTDIDGPTAPSGPGSDLYWGYAGSNWWGGEAVGIVELVPDGVGGDNADYQTPSTVLSSITTEWHSREWRVRRSSAPGVADGQMYAVINGSTELSALTLTTYDSQFTSNTYKQIFGAQNSNSEEPTDGYVYYGPHQIDDSWCLVLTSDGTLDPTKGTSQDVDFCVVTDWSDAEVEMYVRKGIHSSLSGKTLTIRNNAGTLFSVGVGA